ncbi:TIR domain-containing protein [Microbacterium sp. NPDC087589]|uniref:TIR domain-containing protein n=1 Tax=Microbacterium sp. NPDC087589 TaxID=3364191 RepID=UPI0038131E9F
MGDSPVRVFIGSSSEHLQTARYLQSEIERFTGCEATCWDQDVFRLSTYALESLSKAAHQADFAVLLATPDDMTHKRGRQAPSPRDNVIFELGLLMGVLGRERTFLVADKEDENLQLPSDFTGLTYAWFKSRSDGNMRATLNNSMLEIAKEITALGPRDRHPGRAASSSGHAHALELELDTLCHNAESQGWRVKTRSVTTLRLQDRKGVRHTLSLSTPERTRESLRVFARELRAHGLRVNRSIRQPIAESTYQ